MGLFCVVAAATLWSAAAAGEVDTSRPDSVSRVAFIHDWAVPFADDFAAFLATRGISVDLVDMAGAETFDFTQVGAIIVGFDTCSGSPWGTPAAVSNVNGAGRPIFGLGEGGSRFFGELGLSIGYGSTWWIFGTSIVVVDDTDPIWNFPNPTLVSTGDTVELCSLTGDVMSAYHPNPVPGMTRIGREVGDPDHYPLINEVLSGQCYTLWGFFRSPTYMTDLGKDVFVNALHTPCGQLFADGFESGDCSAWSTTVP